MDLRTPSINHLLDLWLNEDLGRGDLSGIALDENIQSAHWVAKQEGIFCGGPLVKRLFQRLDPFVEVELLVQDGQKFKNGEKIMNLQGPARGLIAGERTSINLAMHLSGISTATARLIKELKGSGIQLADTRKTTPGLRVFEKYAVRCGGAINHRMGLDDAAMLKENHIAWASGVEEAIKSIRAASPWTSKIIVEAETPQQAEEAVNGGADGVLLDEMSPEIIASLVPQLRKLANVRGQKIILEASGIHPDDLKKFALTGIDLISTSAPVTRSHWIDFSMRFNKSIENK